MKYPAIHRTGFTLIELLIVIALLGALAVGLLATIDPFEQLKKGRDTALRNTVSEFYNANLRYYSTKSQFPWPTGGGAGSISATPVFPTLLTYVTALINQGELKNRFVELAGTANLAKIKVTSNNLDTVVVCFKPESKGFLGDPTTVYDADGLTTGIGMCKGTGTAAPASQIDCYFCVQ